MSDVRHSIVELFVKRNMKDIVILIQEYPYSHFELKNFANELSSEYDVSEHKSK